MKLMKMFALTVAMSAAVAGCKKKEEVTVVVPATGSGSAMGSGSDTGSAAGSGSGSAVVANGSAAGSGSAAPTPPPRDPNADFVSVFANHAEPKPGDPVEVHIDKFAVTKATFDPKKIEGGTAEITLDMTSVNSGIEKRDHHLQTPDFLDATQFATATIDVDNVKKKTDTQYTADADVKFRGVEKKYPITFDVVSTTDDSIKIKAEQAFSRLDFKIGGPESTDPKVAPVVSQLTLKLQLTLKKT